MRITDRLSLNIGSRWDRVTGFAINSQLSPTTNFVYKARGGTTVHAGFARNFPNFQNVSSGIFKLFAGTTGPLLPARAALLLRTRKPTTPGTLDSRISSHRI